MNSLLAARARRSALARTRCVMRRGRGLPNSEQAGIALIIVMISIFVLTMLAGGFAWSMKVETKLARNANSESQLEWLGRSAVECARWELAQQLSIAQEPYDALNQVWAGGMGGAASKEFIVVQILLPSEATLGCWAEQCLESQVFRDSRGYWEFRCFRSRVVAAEIAISAGR